MSAQIPVSTAVKSRDHGPNLMDSSRFVKVERVPIIDTLERSYFKKDQNGKDVRIKESVDEKQLGNILRNSRLRSERGDHGIVFLGHTDDHGREIDQPPIIGFTSNYEIGEHNGSPTILGDLYIDKKTCNRLGFAVDDPDDVLMQFPRRSAEVISLGSPKGYIDSVALLKRTPERSLGLVTSRHRSSLRVSRFECPACHKEGVKARKNESKMAEGQAHHTVVKNALKLVETMMGEMIRKHTEPSEDDVEMSPPGKYSEVSSSSSEPSMSSRSSQSSRSRYARISSSSDSSDDMSMSSSSSEPSDSSEPALKRKPGKRMDPSGEPSSPSEPSAPAREKKSKMSAGGGAMAGAGAGDPSAYAGYVPGCDTRKPKESKAKSRLSREDEDRMRGDSERISVSRFQKRLEQQDKVIARLQAQLDETAVEKRQAVIERKVGQLEYEGYEIDRVRTVSRLMKMPDTDHEDEIDYIRRFSRRSPVNQPQIPNFSGDYGGGNPERPRPVDLAHIGDPLPEERVGMGKDGVPMYIVGSQVYRFAVDNDIKVSPKYGVSGRRVDNMTAANEAVSRFVEARSKTRAG